MAKKKKKLSTVKKKKLWVLSVSYNADRYPDLDYLAEEIAGKDSDGSGMGFGERDLSFYFNSEKKFSEAYKKFRRRRVFQVADVTEEYNRDD